MLNALAFAFVDAINVLLIGVLVGLAIMLPPGRFRLTAFLLVVGDWLGVLLLSLIVLIVFDGLQDLVKKVMESPLFAILLILTGLVTAILTFRGGDNSELADRILQPLLKPSPLTVGVGLVLGLIQSATSVPFFAGLAVLSTSDIPTATRYLGLFLYATVALSLPIVAALLLGAVRHAPHSKVGELFAKARRHPQEVTTAAGYLVAVLLIGIGVLHLL